MGDLPPVTGLPGSVRPDGMAQPLRHNLSRKRPRPAESEWVSRDEEMMLPPAAEGAPPPLDYRQGTRKSEAVLMQEICALLQAVGGTMQIAEIPHQYGRMFNRPLEPGRFGRASLHELLLMDVYDVAQLHFDAQAVALRPIFLPAAAAPMPPAVPSHTADHWGAPGTPHTGLPSIMQGTVKRFNSQKLWGFVLPTTGGDDVYVHSDACVTTGGGTVVLQEGQMIEFMPVPDVRGKLKAINVTQPGGKPFVGVLRGTGSTAAEGPTAAMGQAGVAAAESKDWICPSCGNHNYASRAACNKCQLPRPAAAVTMPLRDWVCKACNNHNYANRIVCNRCKGPR